MEHKKWKKSYSLRFRFLATVIVAMVAITVFIGGISIYEVDQYMQAQAEDFVKVTCDNEAAQINDRLNNMEKSVKIMESYLMDFFTDKKDMTDRELQQKVIQNADQMFVDIAKHTSAKGTVAYYFRFDPAISDNVSGLFYSKTSGGDEFVSLPPTDISLYEKDDTEHVGWFWEPYEAGEPIWMKPYHNQNNDILMISYVVPMYLDGTFLGIVGMDFDYAVLSDMVHGIRLYENGFAHLESDGVVIHKDDHESEVNAEFDSEKYLQKSKGLVNGMTLILSANYDDIRQVRYDIGLKITFVVVILSVFFILVTVFAVRKIVSPLNQLVNAASKLSQGDFEVETVQSNTSEIELLSAAFDHMTKQIREREEKLLLSANRDSLTGLRNTTSYAAWVSKFDEELQGKKVDFGVIVLDLNELKETNDQYGHAVGDQLIATAAKTIADVFKRSPVFRIGGDEFLVVLQNSDLENYEKLFAQFEYNCTQTFVEEGDVKVPIRIAGGFARFDGEKDRRFADVFKRADDAMYENKSKMKEA